MSIAISGPALWGPYGWKFIHYVTLGYPTKPSLENKERYKIFFESLQYVLPCSICSAHYMENLKEHPLTDDIMSDRNKLIEWGILMHNLVNIYNNKKPLSNKEAKRMIIQNIKEDNYLHKHLDEEITTNGDNNNYNNNKKMLPIYIIIILICIIMFILFMILKYIKK